MIKIIAAKHAAVRTQGRFEDQCIAPGTLVRQRKFMYIKYRVGGRSDNHRVDVRQWLPGAYV
jgi:hypothetical protein